MKPHFTCAITLAIGLFGCKEDSGKSSGPPAAPAAPAAAAVQPQQPAFRPEYKIVIEPDAATPPHYIVKWTAVVNSGGWRWTADSTPVEDRHRELRMASIYATLEAPNPAEKVELATQTVRGEFDAGTQKVDGAELHVRRKVRDQKTVVAPLYGIVARAGKQY